MVDVHFSIEDADYKLFKQLIGNGKVAETLRNYVKSFSSSNTTDEIILSKKFEIACEQKQKVDAEYEQLKSAIEILKVKKKKKELENLQIRKGELETKEKLARSAKIAASLG